MGERGPAPTPTEILRRRGSRKIGERKNEPVPAKGEPRRPDWLSTAALELWPEIIRVLDEIGVLHQSDGLVIGRYCEDYVLWRSCHDHVTKYGMMYPIRTEDGKVKCYVQYPQVAQRSSLDKTLRSFEREFGLTPSARTRISISAKEEADPAADLLKIVG